MGFFSKFEGKVDDAFDGVASSVFKSPIEPTQISKRCEKEMHRGKLVGKGMQYAPTLYTVLVNDSDDKRLFGFYPTMAGEIETFLVGAASDADLTLECRPLVRFIADDGLKSGKFDVIAEVVTSNIIAELREEEAEYYGLDSFAKGSREPIPSRNANPRRPGGTNKRSQGYGNVDLRVPASAGYGDGGIAGGVAGGVAGVAGGAGAAADDGAAEAAADAKAAAYAMLDEPVAGSHARQDNASSGYGSYDEYAMSHGHTPANAPSPAPDPNKNTAYGYQGVLENARTGERIALDYKTMTVGRETYCNICIPDGSVSRNHARLEMDEMGNWEIEDLGSTNGTKVNGRPISRSKLRFGDQVTFGTTVMIFQKG